MTKAGDYARSMVEYRNRTLPEVPQLCFNSEIIAHVTEGGDLMIGNEIIPAHLAPRLADWIFQWFTDQEGERP